MTTGRINQVTTNSLNDLAFLSPNTSVDTKRFRNPDLYTNADVKEKSVFQLNCYDKRRE